MVILLVSISIPTFLIKLCKFKVPGTYFCFFFHVRLGERNGVLFHFAEFLIASSKERKVQFRDFIGIQDKKQW